MDTTKRDEEIREKLKDNPKVLEATQNLMKVFDTGGVYEKVVFKVTAALFGAESKIKKDPSLAHLKIDILQTGFEMVREASAYELLKIMIDSNEALKKDMISVGVDPESADLAADLVAEHLEILQYKIGTTLNTKDGHLRNFIEALGYDLSQKPKTDESRPA